VKEFDSENRKHKRKQTNNLNANSKTQFGPNNTLRFYGSH